MKILITIGLITIFLTGCTSTSAPNSVSIPTNENLPNAGSMLTELPDGILNPLDAIVLAAQSAPEKVPGLYSLQVRAVGERYGVYYFNSEENYREQTNLTIAIFPDAAKSLRRIYKSSLEEAFLGKIIVVNGEVGREVIHFMRENRPSGAYYFQTHINVSDPQQIRIIESYEN